MLKVGLTVRTPALVWLGMMSLLLSTGISFVVRDGWVGIALTLLLFGSKGAALILMSATIRVASEEIHVRRFFSSSSMRWDEVQAASKGGGNLVLYSSKRRVSMPGPEFWWGSEKRELVSFVNETLANRGVAVQKSPRAAAHYDRTPAPKA